MGFVRFLRSTTGRVLRATIGFSLVAYGSTQASLVGLVLMMVGMVPAVTGVAGICLIEEVIKSRETSELPVVRPHEHRA